MVFVDKTAQAKEIIKRCKTEHGYCASTDTYWEQYWLRDVYFSLDQLHPEHLQKHFLMLAKEQRPSGEMPAVIYGKESIPRVIFLNSFRTTIPKSGMLRGVAEDVMALILRKREESTGERRYEIKRNPLRAIGYHSWTGDNEMLFMSATAGLSALKENKKAALRFIEARKDKDTGLCRGAGWLDAMQNFKGKFYLTTNVLLWAMHKQLGQLEKAEKTRNAINNLFWQEEKGYYVNYLGGDRFDALAHAFLLRFKIISESRVESIAQKLNGCLTTGGYINLYPPYSFKECGQLPYRYQNPGVWPFVNAQIVMALNEAGFRESAKMGFKTAFQQKGFNEWYCPLTGEPRGSKGQLWSAAGYLQIKDLF